jgi:hypothetical protein
MNPVIGNYKCWIILVFYFIFFCVLSIRIAHGTTVIFIKNGNEVFIGADSKVKNHTELNCKIRQVNNLFFAFTHYIEIVHPITGIKIFDAVELATKAGTIKGTIRDKVDYFDKLAEVKLTEVLKIWDSIFSKDEIRGIMFGKNELMRVVIICIENSKPIVLERVYSVDNFDVIPLRIKTEKFLDNQNTFVISIGTDSAISSDIERNKRNIIFNPIKSINRLITLQASATPEDVGLPIDILHIAPGKVRWIQHKPQCPEIKTEYFQKSKK